MSPVLVFDSGVGGLTVVSAIRDRIPRQDIVFVADDAWFPYGSRADAEIVDRVTSLVGEVADRIDLGAIVIACNTASTLVLGSLRERFAVPIVGTVPAIKPAAERTESGVIAVLATEGTIRRDFTRSLINTYAKDCHVRLVGSAMLASYAEAELREELVQDQAILAEIRQAFVELPQGRTDGIVLACTHYPHILSRLIKLAPWQVNWFNPAPAIARRLADVLGEKAGGVGNNYAIRSSGRVWPAPLAIRLEEEFGLLPIRGAGRFDTRMAAR